MICPYCAANNDKVIDSRATEAGAIIRRRRQCLSCDKRFTTYERVEKTARLAVIKKDGSRAAFDSSNILKGILAACGKRPIPEDVKTRIVQEVEEEVHREFDREVPSAEIGKRVAAKLREVDEIAYIRFASEYFNFRTLDELAEEVTDLQARPRKSPNQSELFTDAV